MWDVAYIGTELGTSDGPRSDLPVNHRPRKTHTCAKLWLSNFVHVGFH